MSIGIFPAARAANCGNDWTRTSNASFMGATGVLLKANPGRLLRMRIENNSATQYWIQVFDKVSAPVNTDVPIYMHRLNGSSGEIVDFTSIGGIYCATGIGFAISSTQNTLTLAVANNCTFESHWK